jgi:hypothetical protein
VRACVRMCVRDCSSSQDINFHILQFDLDVYNFKCALRFRTKFKRLAKFQERVIMKDWQIKY